MSDSKAIYKCIVTLSLITLLISGCHATRAGSELVIDTCTIATDGENFFCSGYDQNIHIIDRELSTYRILIEKASMRNIYNQKLLYKKDEVSYVMDTTSFQSTPLSIQADLISDNFYLSYEKGLRLYTLDQKLYDTISETPAKGFFFGENVLYIADNSLILKEYDTASKKSRIVLDLSLELTEIQVINCFEENIIFTKDKKNVIFNARDQQKTVVDFSDVLTDKKYPEDEIFAFPLITDNDAYYFFVSYGYEFLETDYFKVDKQSTEIKQSNLFGNISLPLVRLDDELYYREYLSDGGTTLCKYILEDM